MKCLLHRLLPFLRGQFARLHRPRGQEASLLLLAFILALGTFLFVRLADDVREGETQTFDERVLRSLRRADDPGVPVGPAWLREAALDVTALGSPAVLVLVVLVVAGFLLLQRQFEMLWLTLATTTAGTLLAFLLKRVVDRGRPTVVPHLREVRTPSFPSAHAMLSAVVYLTLGILLTQVVRGRLIRLYCLGWALFLTFIVGASRIYLGVHYPTDVLAGWTAGLAWALACWLAAQSLRHRRTAGASAALGPPPKPKGK